MYKLFFKTAIDVIISVFILIFILPLFFIIAVLVKFDSKGPIFFKQKRIGKNLKPFDLLKFRTMTHEKRTVGNTPVIGRVEGVTKLGYYLRRFKIDELPQLFNVLKLEMSLVGPRPNVESKLEGMNKEELTRYNVKPGLTGLAQVSGNIHLSWKRRFELDLLYIENISLITDLRIVFRTVFIILKGEEKFKDKTLKIK